MVDVGLVAFSIALVWVAYLFLLDRREQRGWAFNVEEVKHRWTTESTTTVDLLDLQRSVIDLKRQVEELSVTAAFGGKRG